MKMRVVKNNYVGTKPVWTFRVSWAHIRPGYKNKNKGITDCRIEGESGVLADGRTFCNSKESGFNKEEGRKHSFTRALHELFPNNKAARTQMWEQYFARKKRGLSPEEIIRELRVAMWKAYELADDNCTPPALACVEIVKLLSPVLREDMGK